MPFSIRDYPLLANLLLIPAQLLLVWAVPGLGIDGATEATTGATPNAATGAARNALFMVLVWTGLILEFPAFSLHVRLARYAGAERRFSRFVWVLILFRVILLLVMGVLALEAVGVEMNHWAVQFFVPAYGLIYVLFCLFSGGLGDTRASAQRLPGARQKPSARQLDTSAADEGGVPGEQRDKGTAEHLPPMRQMAIGVFAAFWNLVLLTSLWNIIEAELMAGQPLPQAQWVVIAGLSLLAFLLYVPARLPYLLIEQAGIGHGLRRLWWYVVFAANIIAPIAGAYLR